jgi:hypothetical protein
MRKFDNKSLFTCPSPSFLLEWTELTNINNRYLIIIHNLLLIYSNTLFQITDSR